MQTNISFGQSDIGNTGLQVGINSGNINFKYIQGGSAEEAVEPFSNIPFLRDPDFIEREGLLEDIGCKCSTPNSKLAVVGMGGVGKGKSQLIVEYCYRVREKMPDTFVLWVHASNVVRFEQSYQQIADRLNIAGDQNSSTDFMRSVLKWLQNPTHKWILILDNVDDDTFFDDCRYSNNGSGSNMLTAREFIPTNTNGSIIMTTRRKAIAERFVTDKSHIQVDPMSNVDAQALLGAKLGAHFQLQEEQVAHKLVEALDFIPLAVVQAAAYIKKRAPLFSVQRYIDELEKNDSKRFKLLEQEANNPDRDWEASNSVLVTWQLSFNQIRKTRPSAADLLSLMSFFDRHGIPTRLLHIHAKDQEPRKKAGRKTRWLDGIKGVARRARRRPNKGEVPRKTQLGPVENEEDSFLEDVVVLREYSFLSFGRDTELFEMHRMVQLATRKWLETEGKAEKWRLEFIQRLLNAFPDAGDDVTEKAQMVGQELLPHVEAAMGQRPSSESDISKWTELLMNAAIFSSPENPVMVLRMANAALESRKQIFGLKDEDTLGCMALAGIAHLLLFQTTEAEVLLKEGYEITQRLEGPDHSITLTFLHNLVEVYSGQGRLQEAESAAIKVVEARKRTLGPENAITLKSMGNLILIYHLRGQWKQAEMLGEELVTTRTRILGPDDPDTILAKSNLLITYQSLGRFSDAERLAQETYDYWEKSVSPDNLNYLFAAEGLLKGGIATCKKAPALGPKHRITMNLTCSLATVLNHLGHHKESITLMEYTIVTMKETLGPEHHDTLEAMNYLVVMYGIDNQFSKAEDLALQAFKGMKKALGEDHPSTLLSLQNFAASEKDNGKKADAISHLTQCIGIRERVLSKNHWLSRLSRNLLNSWISESGIVDAAREGRFADVEHLLNQKVDPYHRNPAWGRTALSQAAEYGQTAVVTLLLERKLNPNIADVRGINITQDNTGKTPLMWACMSGHLDVCRLLLTHGADANAKEKDGRSPLFWAAKHAQPDIFKLLLDHGADMSALYKGGGDAKKWAESAGYQTVVEHLSESMERPT
ncbi:hypothetical protein N7456_004364 [Penicillium angulare]|uniref:NB-ARC domain-containing protein n=1 Tax=Penicillium angulare TaxID=116970 RepID=A0A9W9FWG8_9EURO|nr:hypothetical protein N7456_004364 [Penicillium angulare]